MATFIMMGTYSPEAIKEISSERTAQATKIIEEAKGKLMSIYATMGDFDLLAVVEFPGIAEAIKASVNLNRALEIAFSTVPALGVEEFDKVAAG